MTRIRIVGTASTISAQLAAMQPLGLVPAGKPITWDSRATDYPDYLAAEKS